MPKLKTATPTLEWVEIATAQDGSRREYAEPLVGGHRIYRLITPGKPDQHWGRAWAGPCRTLAEVLADLEASPA